MITKLIDLKKIKPNNIDNKILDLLEFLFVGIDPCDEVFKFDQQFGDDLKIYVWSNEQLKVSAALLCDKNYPAALSLVSMYQFCKDKPVNFTISVQIKLLLV